MNTKAEQKRGAAVGAVFMVVLVTLSMAAWAQIITNDNGTVIDDNGTADTSDDSGNTVTDDTDTGSDDNGTDDGLFDDTDSTDTSDDDDTIGGITDDSDTGSDDEIMEVTDNDTGANTTGTNGTVTAGIGNETNTTNGTDDDGGFFGGVFGADGNESTTGIGNDTTDDDNVTGNDDDDAGVDEDEDEFDRVFDEDDEEANDAAATRAYYGHGWALSDDRGFLTQALWFRNTASDNNINGDEEAEISTTAGGLLKLDIGDDAQTFRLMKRDSPEDTIVFDVIPRDDDDDNTTAGSENSVGTLTLVRIPHSDVTRWDGLLELEGTGNGMNNQYHVELGTRSVVVVGVSGASELVEDQNEPNITNEDGGFLSRLLSRLRGQ